MALFPDRRCQVRLPPSQPRDTLNNPSARLNVLCVELQSTDLFRPSLEGDEPVPGYDLSREDLAHSYTALLASRGQAFRDVFAALASSPGEPAVFFCAGGTDRTGMIAALVLGLAGVPDDVIAGDYSLSAHGLVRRFTAEGAPAWMSPDDLASGRALATLARPATMIELRRLVRRDYGGVTAYLRSVGVTTDEIALIRQSLAD